MLDMIVLQTIKNKGDYFKYANHIPRRGLLDKTLVIADAFGRYFREFEEHDTIDFTSFTQLFFNFYKKGCDEDTKLLYGKMFLRIRDVDIDTYTKETLLDKLLETEYAMKLADILEAYKDGEEVDLIAQVNENTENAAIRKNKKKRVSWVEDDITEIMEEDGNNQGLHWRLPCLNGSMRGLRGGDFGIIAGRPDTGKTSFISSEVTRLAPQMYEYFGEERNVLWFNNEGSSRSIKQRIYQAALGINVKEMVEMARKGTLQKAYDEAVGRHDIIRVINAHDMSSSDIRTYLDKMNPGIIIYDMLDNVSHITGAAAATHEKVEEVYKWGRVMSHVYDSAGLATSQISAAGDLEMFPSQAHLKNSTTGKQGACDFQIMIGTTEDTNSGIRGIGIVKNKLQLQGKPRNPQARVNFDFQTGRYYENEAQ